MTLANLKKSNVLTLSLGFFLLPLLEIYKSFFGHRVQILGFAVEEILLLLWVGFTLLSSLAIAILEKRKTKLVVTGSILGIFLIYLILHGLAAARFDSALLPGADPDFFREVYYTVRLWLAPGLLVLSSYLSAFPREKMAAGLRGTLWVLSLGVVIPCLAGFSFASYANGNVPVAGGFFSWFTLPDTADFSLYTAKGLFLAANDIGAILFGLSPFAAEMALHRGTWWDWSLLTLTGLASVMVGTKIAGFGFFLVLGGMILLSFLEKVLRRKKLREYLPLLFAALLGIALFFLLLHSPGYLLQKQREVQKSEDNRTTESVGEIEEVLQEESTLAESETEKLKTYLASHHWDHFIDPWFLELYPVECDPEFWAQVVGRNNFANRDARSFKLEMIRRIRERNETSWDTLFGIGWTSGVPYAERDYFHQYYQFGALGVAVLILPYLLLLMVSIREFFLALVRRKTLTRTGMVCLGLGAFLFTAYFAGHVFDTLFTTYALAGVSAYLVGREAEHE